MTGGEARCSNRVGARFTAWDGYISGSNISLRPGVQIRQRWRTSDFKPDDPFSNLVLHLSPAEGGCTIHLTHSNIPDGQPDYLQGWHDHYFVPMDAYFSKK